jgi:hypothetical protein
MKFDFDGASYLIDFERSTKERPAHVQPKKLDEKTHKRTSVLTRAVVYKIVGPDPKVDRVVVREARVGHYWKDRFNYEAGRKLALARALYDAPTGNGGEPIIGTRLSKAFKTAVWKAYHTRQGSPIAWKE